MSAATNITVRVSLAVRCKPGRKTIVSPSGEMSMIRTRADPTMVKALARAFRWKPMLEMGGFASISEIAATEKIDRGFVGTLLRLTLLAPDIVEAILNGTQPATLGLPALLKPLPVEWDRQRDQIYTLARGTRSPKLQSEP